MPNRSVPSTEDGDASAVPGDDRHPVVRAVELRWKHALVALIVGGTTYALYEVGGWTLDAIVFGVVTLAIVAYSVLTYRSDVR